jgi:hypothetical protein
MNKHGFPMPFDVWMASTKEWNLNKEIFNVNKFNALDGWHKWMVINLNCWVDIYG